MVARRRTKPARTFSIIPRQWNYDFEELHHYCRDTWDADCFRARECQKEYLFLTCPASTLELLHGKKALQTPSGFRFRIVVDDEVCEQVFAAVHANDYARTSKALSKCFPVPTQAEARPPPLSFDSDNPFGNDEGALSQFVSLTFQNDGTYLSFAARFLDASGNTLRALVRMNGPFRECAGTIQKLEDSDHQWTIKLELSQVDVPASCGDDQRIPANQASSSAAQMDLFADGRSVTMQYDPHTETLRCVCVGRSSQVEICSFREVIRFCTPVMSLNDSSLTKIAKLKLYTAPNRWRSVGRRIARAIVQQREVSPFVDWTDFLTRLSGPIKVAGVTKDFVELCNANHIDLTSFFAFQHLPFKSRVSILRPGAFQTLLPKQDPDGRVHAESEQNMDQQGLVANQWRRFGNSFDSDFEDMPGNTPEEHAIAMEQEIFDCSCEDDLESMDNSDEEGQDGMLSDVCHGVHSDISDNRMVEEPSAFNENVGRVLVFIVGKQGRRIPKFGTAIVIGKRTILTNAHCLVGLREHDFDTFFELGYNAEDISNGRTWMVKKPNLDKYVKMIKTTARSSFRVLKAQSPYKWKSGETAADFAVGFCEGECFQHWEPLAPVDWRSQGIQGVRMAGYGKTPPINDRPKTKLYKKLNMICEWLTSSRGAVVGARKSPLYKGEEGLQAFRADYFALGGHSGSPVFRTDRHGRVLLLGLHSASHKNKDPTKPAGPLCVQGPVITPKAYDFIKRWMKAEEDTPSLTPSLITKRKFSGALLALANGKKQRS